MILDVARPSSNVFIPQHTFIIADLVRILSPLDFLRPHGRSTAFIFQGRRSLDTRTLSAEAEGFEPSDQFPGQHISSVLL
jgi:hypothetical protein